MSTLFPVTNFGKNKLLGTDEKGNVVGKELTDLYYGTYNSTDEYDETEMRALLKKGLILATIGTTMVLLFAPDVADDVEDTVVFGGAKGYHVVKADDTYTLVANT